MRNIILTAFFLVIKFSDEAPLASKQETSFHTLTVCRGQMRSIACPNIQLLHIYNAFYGKLSGHDCQDPVSQLRDQIPTCFSRDAPRIIREACQGQQSCDLYAEDSLYNDPCPLVNKYLFVSFTCQGKSNLSDKLKMFDESKVADLLPGNLPTIEKDGNSKIDLSNIGSQRMYAIVCSGQTGNIFCPSLKLLHIRSAVYGKQEGRSCDEKVPRDSIPSCSSQDAARVVKDMCDGQQSCDLFSEPELYGRSLCDAKAQKYLQVEYTCDGHSDLSLQLSKNRQPFVYQPQETPQNPFLRSQIPLPDYQYNQWFQLWKKTLPMPFSFPQYNVFNNEQLVGLQKQRMEQQRSYQQQLALQRNLVLRKQQEAITKQIQEASKVRSLNAARVLQTHVQPVLNTASQRQSIQYQSPLLSYPLNQVPYSQPQNLALSPSYQPYPIQALSPQSWSGPESVKLWPPSDESSNIWNKGTSVNSFFGSRHSTCEQCNGDCRNYLCYGCGGCQEPPPEQQTYYYPYQRHDAAYHDAFLGNEMALSGMVIWPLPKIPWKTEAEKIEEEKKLARSKVEKDDDEDDDSNGDDDNDSDDNDLSLKKSKIMVKTIKKSNATKKISKKPLSNKPASTKKVMKKKKKHSRN